MVEVVVTVWVVVVGDVTVVVTVLVAADVIVEVIVDEDSELFKVNVSKAVVVEVVVSAVGLPKMDVFRTSRTPSMRPTSNVTSGTARETAYLLKSQVFACYG